MTKWSEHFGKWGSCKNCELCETRKRIVLFKGKIPCDILFIGEAPGRSEDLFGRPFAGPAGHLLDKIIKDAELEQFKLGYTNLVACIPLDIDGDKTSDPDKEHISACGDRLVDTVVMCRPRSIVAVGRLAHKWVPKVLKDSVSVSGPNYTHIIHPGSILRADITQKGLQQQQATIRLMDLGEHLI